MIKGLHIELTNKCTLKCPRCSRTEFIEQFPTKWKNKDLDIKQLMEFLDIDLKGVAVNFCGNYGDPIYHDGMIDAVRALKQRQAKVIISTNGSYRSKDWWKELSTELTSEDSVIFAIDGLPDNFTKYRINADWPSILEGINVLVDSPVKLLWQYILFSYNLDSVEEARELSQKLGFDEFFTIYSDRWDRGVEFLTPEIDKASASKQQWKEGQEIDINPLCVSSSKEHYVSADGFYAPCCWMAEHRFYYKSEFYRDKKMYDIRENTLGEILDRKHIIDFYDSIEDKKLRVCQFNCPRVT